MTDSSKYALYQELIKVVGPGLYEDINASRFIGRSPAKETNLNTFVFKNQDGTQTMKVYSHPVKYIDEIGGIQDISTDIKVNKDAFYQDVLNNRKEPFCSSCKASLSGYTENITIPGN